MKLTKVHLFVVLLLALVFCSFLGGACTSGAGLEGFNMPSDTHPYKGTGQYSDKYSSYRALYSANDKYSKQQDDAYDRKDKLGANSVAPDADASKYTPYVNVNASASANANGSNQGIPASQIPPGQEDLYMLKSEMVPPVCPACPSMKCDASSSDGKNKCPPCPPCARCPEPAFECKKVPNYSGGNDNVLPRPVLNSFSQFGL